jgi:two-component system response regulator YesN
VRILLVDDEDLSRRALRVTIERELPEYEIVGEACDGEEAVELVGRLEPDLTIMDIKMPELDGIEAARTLRDQGTLSRLVFLTAYDEFDYARSAVDLQADAYLLKPVDRQELVQVIRRCGEVIREEAVRARSVLSGGERDRLREWAYRQVVLAAIDGDSGRFEELTAGVGLPSSPAVLAVVRLPEGCDGCMDTVERALRADRTVARYDLDGGTTAFLVFEGGAQEVADRIEKRCRNSAQRGSGARVAPLSEVGPTSRALFQAMANALGRDDRMQFIVHPGGSEIGRSRPTDSARSVSAVSPPIRGLVGRLVNEREEGERQRLLSEVFTVLEAGGPVSLESARCFVIELATMVRLQLPVPDGGVTDPSAVDLTSVLRARSVDEVRRVGAQVVEDLLARLQSHGHPELSWRLSRALDYITAHLASDLYIDEVADAVGIGPQHLSRLFKDELDSSFTRYLNERRIDHARFLLLTSPLNVAEIADRVGFRDANYFGKVFRRTTGVTPTQYRTHLREGES